MTELLTPVEAAALVRRSASSLAKLRLYGGGPAYIKAGSKVLYRRVDLEDWVAARVFRSTSEYSRAS